jgi:predicted lipid-binding transport protein (Tim44 family)
MPEETGGSAIAWLLYALTIYWIASSWHAHLTRLVATDDVSRQREGAIDPQPTASLHGRPNEEDRATALSEILRRESAATIDEFLARTLTCYEAVIAAFNSGDRKTLERLVSPDVYAAFEHAIVDRESTGITVEAMFARLEPPEIIDAVVDVQHMEICVRFVGEVYNLSRNPAGRLIEETRTAHHSVDVWTFARQLSPRSSSWHLVETRTGA